jgi:hypothetical protein
VGEAFAEVSNSMSELINTFYPTAVVGDTTFGLTIYTFWLLVACALCVAVLLVFTKKQSASLVPHGVFVNGVEYLIEFVRNDIAKAMLGDTWRKHFPFLATLFFFVLFGNYIGMLPTWKPGTGSTGVTGAIALMSFCYFIYIGVRKKGLWGYVKSLAPSGLMLPDPRRRVDHRGLLDVPSPDYAGRSSFLQHVRRPCRHGHLRNHVHDFPRAAHQWCDLCLLQSARVPCLPSGWSCSS